MELNYEFNNTCFSVLCGLSCFQCIKKKHESSGLSSVSPGKILVFINGMGPLCCSSSLRSETGSQLGAAPPEEEAEFPAVCSGERGLLTPRNPEKKRRRLGGLTVCDILSGGGVLYRGDLGSGDFLYAPRESDS